MQHQVILSLGSNLGDRQSYLKRAIQLIDLEVGTIISSSKIYETPAWGFDSHHFLNAAVLIHTFFSPEIVLKKILAIEKKLGRNRNDNNGYQARTVDIDIITYDQEVIKIDHLVIPHPQLAKRKFVLTPMADICPNWAHPETKIPLKNLLQNTPDHSKVTAVGELTVNLDKYREKVKNHIVIEGNIGSGKTSLTTKISEDFGVIAILESFENNPFIEDFYANPDCKSFSLEMYFLLARIDQLKAIQSPHYIIDYHLEKCLLFAKETLCVDEYALFNKIFNHLSKKSNSISTFVYLDQPIEKLLHQIRTRGRSFEKDISAHYLNKIDKAYQKHFTTIAAEKKIWVDMSHLDFVKNPGDYWKILAQIFTD